jgi:hypothetical protein
MQSGGYMKSKEQLLSDLQHHLSLVKSSVESIEPEIRQSELIQSLAIAEVMNLRLKTIADGIGIPYHTMVKWPAKNIAELFVFIRDEKPAYLPAATEFINRVAQPHKVRAQQVLNRRPKLEVV